MTAYRVRPNARRVLVQAVALIAVWAAAGSNIQAQKSESKPARPVVLLDDAFEYALVDFGVGAVPESLIGLRRQSKRFLWVKVQLTSRAKDQLARPKYWSSFSRFSGFPPIDNFGNPYPAEARSIRPPRASSGRYQPGESSVELILIPADELLDTIKEMHSTNEDSHSHIVHSPFCGRGSCCPATTCVVGNGEVRGNRHGG
jgi:hypothetical protein